eukprot:6199411-Pleurochrysis_carterae.AAC.2
MQRDTLLKQSLRIGHAHSCLSVRQWHCHTGCSCSAEALPVLWIKRLSVPCLAVQGQEQGAMLYEPDIVNTLTDEQAKSVLHE